MDDRRGFQFLEQSSRPPMSKRRAGMLLAAKLLTAGLLFAVVVTIARLAWALARVW
jgi:hypothetical protein